MLSAVFSPMVEKIWSKCPSTTNAVERKNKDCKSDNPKSLKMAMTNVYKIDKVVCLKHIGAQEGISLTYRSRSEEARKTAARKKQQQRYKNIPPDKSAQFGPPDRYTNFTGITVGKRTRDSNTTDNCKRSKLSDGTSVLIVPNLILMPLGKE